MNEPASYTDVADAFDGADLFDLNLHIGFVRSRESATIRRETNDGAEAIDIGEYERFVNRLDVGLDIGVYRDLALYLRLPLVLSDIRQIRASDSRSAADINDGLCLPEPGLDDGECTGSTPSGTGEGNYLFTVPAKSPTRSGLDYLGFGLAYSIFNQRRVEHLPTWVLMVEGRFGIGKQMQACLEFAEGRECRGDGSSPGLSRGTHALRLETRMSRRYRYAEPYSGLAFQIEWPKSGNDSIASGNIEGILNDLPPRLAEFTAGVLIVPWEHRGRWQRFAVDLRASAEYTSEGREYSSLFDALGASNSGYLTLPNSEGIPNDSFDPREVEFTGVTDVQAHGRFGARIGIEVQAARYVRFALGTGIFYTTPHLLTFTDACNPSVTPTTDDDPRTGRCRVGIINPNHRPAIDVTGHRFRQEGMLTLDLYANATLQF